MPSYQLQKQVVKDMFAAVDNSIAEGKSQDFKNTLAPYIADQYQFYGCHPFGEMHDIDDVCNTVWQPLFSAFNSMQRREDIFIAGTNTHDDKVWVMSMGHWMGLFDADWLGLKATSKTTLLRYAEFHCVENGKIVKSSLFFDIIGFMQQIGLQPLPLQTGASFTVPGPKTHDGLCFGAHDDSEATATLALVNRMVDDLTALNKSGNDNCPPEILEETWHNDMAWYGPGGIGSVHTIKRYQRHHMFPFRKGLKDKVFKGHVSRFAEGNYACFFGWPNLSNTPTGGFLGLPGGQVKANMQVVDVYRRDGDKLAENWVIIDIPYWLMQQGLDIIKRTAEISNPSDK
ncbi:MAG: hypothetical protein ACJAVV_000724 [Alphaproteobacteria bacterium]|jgi:hypothetical protein